MLAQIFLTALVPGTVVLVINLFRNRYLDKPLTWNALRILAYLFVAVSSAGLAAINPDWFNSFEGYFYAVPLCLFMPACIEWACLLAADNLGISKKATNKAEAS